MNNLKATKVSIQTNNFDLVPTADTQEDNHGGIKSRWDLFQNGKKVGKMVEFYTPLTPEFAVFHGSIRYDFEAYEVYFSN